MATPDESSTLSLHDALPILAEGSLNAARLPTILKHIAADRPYWTLVEVGTDVLVAAETLVAARSEEHTSELQSHHDLVCRLLLEKKKRQRKTHRQRY